MELKRKSTELKRKILNVTVAIMLFFGSLPMNAFLNTYAEGETAGEVPKSLKTVKTNNDGTYDITLEIEGVSSKKNDATKANVVVVYDTSGSMSEAAVYAAATNGRYGLVGGEYVNLHRRRGASCDEIEDDSTTGTVYSDSSCRNTYSGTRYKVDKTRMDVAQAAVNGLAEKLMAWNDPTNDDFKDVVQMAFIDFATYTGSTKGPTVNLTTFQGWVNNTPISSGNDAGTNWEAALNAANNVSFGDTDKTYIIFVSDGNPTFRDSRLNAGYYDTDGCRSEFRTFGGGCSVWGSGNSDPDPHRNFSAAKTIADAIVGNTNKELYAVGAFGDATNMQNLGGTYKDAANQSALEAAFDDIADKITMGLSVADLQIEDGITTATSAEIKGTAGNFRYSVPESWGTDYHQATFENGSVHWNPGEYKTLSNGEKASVTFTVWPSQEAMDCIASIRNNDGGCSMTDAELATFGLGKNEDGSFRLITNSKATFKYRTATKIEGSDEQTYSALSPENDFDEQRDPTNLPETDLEVMKLWADGMDPGQRDDIKEISLDLFIDREENSDPIEHYVFNREGSEGNAWKNSYTYAVAPGVMKKLDGTPATEGLRGLGPIVKVGETEYVVLEPGHDYEFDNEEYELNDGGSNHYHITKRKYHPMIVDDGGIHDVIFSEDGEFTTAEIDQDELTTLSVENTLNGGILVSKVVINNDKDDKEITDEYEIKISITGENAQNGLYRIYTYNADGTLAPNGKGEKKPYSNGTITEKITVNQKIMVVDVPTGTTFTVTEQLPEGYTSNKVEYEVIQYTATGVENKPGINEVFGNASSTATVTNYLESGDLIISKEVTATNGDLKQAQGQEFSFTVNFYKKEGDKTAIRTETFTLKHGETKEISSIPVGWYYEIVEDAKAGFNDGLSTTKTGTIEKGDNEEKFTNNYKLSKLNDNDAKIVAIKSFVDGYQQFWLNSDQFVFQLTGNGQVLESKTVTLSNDTAEFIVNITDAGTYTYTITEKTKNEDGSSAFRPGVSRLEGDQDIVVMIETKDNGDGTMGLVSKTYSKESRKIFNLYEATGTYGVNGELVFNKVLEGRDWEDSDEFTFTISSQDEGAPLPEMTEITIGEEDKDDIDFGTIEFSTEDVGKTYNYVVTESFNVPSVEPAEEVKSGISFSITVTDNEDGTLNLQVSEYDTTFTNIYKTTELNVSKVWDDGGDRDGLRENYEDYFVAVKDDEGNYVAYEELASENKDYTFDNLPEKNVDGEEIAYTAVEASSCSETDSVITCVEFNGDDDYTVTIKDGVITNKHEAEGYGDLIVEKVWSGKGNVSVRPTSIQIQLYANDEKYGDAVTISEIDGWKHTYEGLYKNDGGTPITYSVQELALGTTEFNKDESIIIVYEEDGETLKGQWEKSILDFTITNTWTEASDEIEYEGESEFTIKKVDEEYETMSGVTFTINDGDETTGDDGEIKVAVEVSDTEKEETLEYAISEKETKEGYDLVNGSATVTVTCTSTLSRVDKDRLVNIYEKTCTFSEEGDTAYDWDEDELILTVVNNRSMAGLKIEKTFSGVTEEVLSDLTFTISGPEDFGTNGEMTISFKDDCSVANGKATCNLGQVPTGEYTVTESNAEVENFTLTTTGDNGTTKEVTKENETTVFSINNEYEVISDVTYKVKKNWEDDNDRDGIRPEGLAVTLMQGNTEYETVTLAGDDWNYEWTGLPRAAEDGTVYEYSAVEEELGDYESDGGEMKDGVFTFTNTHEPEKYNGTGELTVKKAWDNTDALEVLPTSVEIELLKNGEPYLSWTVNAEGEWSHTFKGLYKNEGGEEISYTVREKLVDGADESTFIVYGNDTIPGTEQKSVEGKWIANVSGFNVMNTWEPASSVYQGSSQFTILKLTDMGEPMSGVTFTINGEEYTTDDEGLINYTIDETPEVREDEYEFTIKETATREGYDLVEGEASLKVTSTSELVNVDEKSLENTYEKTFEFTSEGPNGYEFDEEGMFIVINNRSLTKSFMVKKIFEGVTAEQLSELTFTVTGPVDFGEDGEMTIYFSEDCDISEGVAVCELGQVPTGEYTVTENNAEVPRLNMMVTGDGETKEVESGEEVVFEITNIYIDPCADGEGCGGNVPEAPETGRNMMANSDVLAGGATLSIVFMVFFSVFFFEKRAREIF